MRIKPLLFVLLWVFMIVACNDKTLNKDNQKSQKPVLSMANPASVYCLHLKGQLINTYSPEGEDADCLLPNGKRLNQWDLYRKNH